MTSALDWKQLATGIPVLGLLAVLLLGSRLSLLERRAAEIGPQGDSWQAEPAAQGAGGGMADYLDSSLEVYTGMPAYVDLQDALRRLAAIRGRSAKSPGVGPRQVSGEGETADREAVLAVQSSVQRLRCRVPPEVFARLMMLQSDRLDRDSLEVLHQDDVSPIGGEIE